MKYVIPSSKIMKESKSEIKKVEENLNHFEIIKI